MRFHTQLSNTNLGWFIFAFLLQINAIFSGKFSDLKIGEWNDKYQVCWQCWKGGKSGYEEGIRRRKTGRSLFNRGHFGQLSKGFWEKRGGSPHPLSLSPTSPSLSPPTSPSHSPPTSTSLSPPSFSCSSSHLPLPTLRIQFRHAEIIFSCTEEGGATFNQFQRMISQEVGATFNQIVFEAILAHEHSRSSFPKCWFSYF